MLGFLNKKKRDPEEIIRDLFGDTELPSFPTMVMEALGLLRSPTATMNEIAALIEQDPGLNVKVLRTVNSAAFGLSTSVNHVGHAASLLGRSRLESILLSVAVNSSLPRIAVEGFDYGAFWFTAAKRAGLARLLAQRLHPSTEVEAFTAGLLLDMGIPLLVCQKKEEYVAVYRQWQNNPATDLEDLEHEAFGFNHTEVGAIVAGFWQLPGYLVTAISDHHSVDESQEVEQAIRLVALLRDSELDDGTAQIKEISEADFELPDDVMEEMIKKAFQIAGEFKKVLE